MVVIGNTKRFFMTTAAGTPVVYKPKYVNLNIGHVVWREWRFTRAAVPATLFLGWAYATWATDWTATEQHSRDMDFARPKPLI